MMMNTLFLCVKATILFLDKSIEPIILQLLGNILCFVFFFITLFRLSRSTISCTIYNSPYIDHNANNIIVIIAGYETF